MNLEPILKISIAHLPEPEHASVQHADPQRRDLCAATDTPCACTRCGLTVYARGHIGNFRTFVCIDVLRRTLRHLLGYRVRQVMNFTDVDDRTIAGAQKAGIDLRMYTDQYIAAFREDAARAWPRECRGNAAGDR